jgi:hypothetical protein
MVVEQNLFNKKEFLELFHKRFSSFCEKSPLFLRFTILDDGVLVYDLSRNPENKPIKFDFDFSQNEKFNIKRIKDYLIENCYPIVTVTEKFSSSLSTIEIQDKMVKEGLSFQQAISKTNDTFTETKYRIEKVLNYDNRIIARNLTENKEPELIELKIPVTIFIREVFNNELNASDIFKNKTTIIKSVVDKREA